VWPGYGTTTKKTDFGLNALPIQKCIFFCSDFIMTCSEIIKEIELWAPREIAWQKDNVGLQVGSLNRKVNNILLCLELTPGVMEEALKKQCNLIISHHPLLFHPMKKIDINADKTSRLVEKLIRNNVTLYSAHTNLDYTRDGVSFILAKTLNLRNTRFLVNLKSNLFKISVFVPVDHLERVAEAAFDAGAGMMGEYSHASFRSEGTGTFKPGEKANPSVGKKGKFEKVKEIKFETIAESWKISRIISDIRKVHPYEEPAYDIIPIDNVNTNYGSGAIGELETPLSTAQFLKHVSKSLKASNLRYSKGREKIIKKVAVCGGSGIEYLSNAVSSGADAFITADIKYHSFHDAEGEILLIDAGHYETEIHSLNEIKRRLEILIKEKKNIKVFKYSGSTNPIIFFNN